MRIQLGNYRIARKMGMAALVLLPLLVVLGTVDAPETNAKYLLWKTGYAPSLYRFAVHLALNDHQLPFLQGKSQTEIHRWFPVLTPCSQCHDAYRQMYIHLEHMTDADTQWVADTHYVLRFRNGGFYEIFWFKG